VSRPTPTRSHRAPTDIFLPLEVRIELAAERRRQEAAQLESRWTLRRLEREAWRLYFAEVDEWLELRRDGVTLEHPRPPAPVKLPRFRAATPIRRDRAAEPVSWPEWLAVDDAEAYIRGLRIADWHPLRSPDGR
jgi:hypothetical protein